MAYYNPYILFNWVVFHLLYKLTNQGLHNHCSLVQWDIVIFAGDASHHQDDYIFIMGI